MAANVFFVIIPAHWELVRAKQEGREPDPAPGLRAKQRSVHNNYLTLAGRLHDAGGPLPARLRAASAPGSSCSRSSRSSSRSGTSSTSGTPGGGRGGSSARPPPERSRSRSCSRPTTTPATAVPDDAVAQSIVAERCQTCHSGVVGTARRPARDPRADGAARRPDRGDGLVARDAAGQRDRAHGCRARAARRLGGRARIGSRRARDHRRRNALRRALGGRAGAEDRGRLQGDPAARRPDHPLPLERRVELDPVGRPRPRHRPRERDELSAPGRAGALPRRPERDGAPLPVRLLLASRARPGTSGRTTSPPSSRVRRS